MLINITCKYSLLDLLDNIDPEESKENILELIVNDFLTNDFENRDIETEIKEIYDDLYEYNGEDGEFAKNFPTVDDLIADVISEIDSSKHTTNELNSSTSSNITRGRSHTYKKHVLLLFNNDLILEHNLTQNFRKKFIEHFLFYRSESHLNLVRSNETLNRSIINLKRSLILTLARYVDNREGTDYANKIKGIYDFSEKESMDLLRSIFSLFEDMIKKDHYKVLLKGWEKQFNKYVPKDDSDVSMLDASNAYIMLNHFDHLIKTLGEGIVQISGNFKGKSYEWFLPDKNPVIKYVVSSKNAHSVKNWNIGEFRDALSEVSDLEKLICEILEVKGEDGKSIVSDINMSQIGDIWSKLVKLLNKYVNDGTGSEYEDKLKSYVSNYHNNPNEYIHLIFREIFEPDKNENQEPIKKFLTNPKIDNTLKPQEYYILKALNDQIFSVKEVRSISRIENASISRNVKASESLTEINLGKYLLQDIIIGAMTGIAEAKYLETRNKRSNQETRYIPRHSALSKQIYDTIEGVNSEVANASIYMIKDKIDGVKVMSESHLLLTIKEQVYDAVAIGSDGKRSSFIGNNFRRLKLVKHLTEDDIKNIKKEVNSLHKKLLKSPYKQLIPENLTFEEFDIYSDLLYEFIKELRKPLNKQKEENKKNGVEDKTLNNYINELSNNLEKIEPYDFSESKFGKITKKELLSENDENKLSRALLAGMLDFIDRMLGLNLNSELGLTTLHYARITQSLTLRPIMESAVKTAFIYAFRKKQLEENVSIAKLARGKIDSSFGIKNYSGIEDDYSHVYMFYGEPTLKILSNESWIDKLLTSLSALLGSSITATTNDINRHKIANFRPTSLATEYMHYIQELRSDKTAAMNNGLLQQDPALIVDVCYDTQFETTRFDKIVTKKANVSELLYNGIVNNFWGSIWGSSKFHIIPTVYSDKTAFVTYTIDANRTIKIPEIDAKTGERKSVSLLKLSKDLAESVYLDTVGTYFLNSFKKIVSDFNKLFKDSNVKNWFEKHGHSEIFNVINTTKSLSDEHIQYVLERMTSSDMEEVIKTYNSVSGQHINIGKEIHYRKSGNHLSLNETAVYYAKHQFNQKEVLSKRFEIEKLKFLELLIKNRVRFLFTKNSPLYKIIEYDFANIFTPYDLKSDEYLKGKLDFDKKVNKEKSDFKEKWVKNGRLVLAYDSSGKEILFSEDIKGNVELNPLLEKYFYLDNIISANIKYSLVGSEIPDPLKFNYTIKDSNGNKENIFILRLNEKGFNVTDGIKENLRKFDLTQLYYYIEKLKKVSNPEALLLASQLSEVYTEISLEVIAIGEGALYKRNVIVPGTRNPMLVESITGVGKTTKVAICLDTLAEIFGYDGLSDTEDADDGSARILPFLAILENGSLTSREVGYGVKKPIWYHMDNGTGTSVLLKFATFTITNGMMRISKHSKQRGIALMKKMCNMKWDKSKVKDITNQVYNKKGDNEGNHRLLELHFAANLSSGNSVCYEREGDVYHIREIRKVGNVYYTKEINKSTNTTYWVANVFDEDSNIIKISSTPGLLLDKFVEKNSAEFEKYSLLDSLFKLWLLFGGLNSVEYDGENWVGSENSNYAVVNVMNNVFTHPDAGVEYQLDEGPLQNQKNFPQPLKEAMIGYIANVSAVKRGQFNVNSANVWTDESATLEYVELNNKGLGVQMDPDHEADDDVDVAEMTLVLASLDVGGELHDIAKNAFQDLGLLISHGYLIEENLLKEIQLATDQKDQDLVRSQLYDILAREFIRSFKANNILDLSINLVKRVETYFKFRSSDQHAKDEIKLAASDPNIFNSIISAFVGKMNKNSMKRRYSGLAAVMMPGYNFAQMFHFKSDSGYIDLTSHDVAKEAYNFRGVNLYKIEQTTSEDDDNKDVTYTLPKTSKSITLHKFGNTFTLDVASMEGDKVELSELERLLLLVRVLKDIPRNGEIKLKLDLKIEDVGKIKKSILNAKKVIESLAKLGLSSNEKNTYKLIKDPETNENVTLSVLTKNILTDDKIESVLVKEYLEQELRKDVYLTDNINRFQPTDIVNIIRDGKVVDTINLDKRDAYYDFKRYFGSSEIRDFFKLAYLEVYSIENFNEDEFQKFIDANFENYWNKNFSSDNNISKDYFNKWKYRIRLSLYNDLKFLENIIQPTNLRPQRVSFETIDGITYNLFDLDAVKNAHLSERIKNGTLFDKRIDTNISSSRDDILNAMKNLVNGKPVIINGKEVNIKEDSIVNEAAEMMMSSIYAAKFGLTSETMHEMDMELPYKHLRQLYDANTEFVLVGNKYTKGLTFNPDKLVTINDINEIIILEDGIYKIYKESKTTGQPEYLIGVQILSSEYEQLDGVIRKIGKPDEIIPKEVLDKLVIKDDVVYENIYFLEEGNLENEDPAIAINKEVAEKYKVNLSELMTKFIKHEDFIRIQLSKSIKPSDIDQAIINLELLNSDSINKNYFKFYKDYLQLSIDTLKSLNKDKFNLSKDSITINGVNGSYLEHIQQILNKENKLRKHHFDLSKMFIAARIPAQSLLSYMLMKCVGFIPTNQNQCMVSHWQTWLQGSDYDIDKAFMMGFSFDQTGKFEDWSPLFNYSSKEAALASLSLPVPKGIQIKPVITEESNRITAERKLKELEETSPEIVEDLRYNIKKVFDYNPQLKDIGSEEDYLLHVIHNLGDSKLKSIVWHGTNSDFSKGFDSASRGTGSSAPETRARNDFYFAKLDWSVLLYINGINRNPSIIDKDFKDVNHWNKLWWTLKEILGNGSGSNWADERVTELREYIPNKRGESSFEELEILRKTNIVEYNKLLKNKKGKYLHEVKTRFGKQSSSDKDFLKEIFDFNLGEESFNEWVARKKKEFQDIAKQHVPGLYPAIIISTNPFTEEGLDTRYGERGVFETVKTNGHDAIFSSKANNEFNSDVVVVTDLTDDTKYNRIKFLGSELDVNYFKAFVGNNIDSDLEAIHNATREADKKIQESKNVKGNDKAVLIRLSNKYRALSIQLKANLLRKIYNLSNDNQANISIEKSKLDKYQYIIDELIEHENWLIPTDKYEDAIKNSISGRIQQIVSNPKNILSAYSPITMKSLRDSADNSSKGQLVRLLTGMNPATKFIMLKQNMEGKDVIGISAVGEKIFMGLSYYFNEALTDLENSENYQFIFKTNRISGRQDAYGKGVQSDIVTKITDVNLTNLTGDSLNIVKSKLFLIERIHEFLKQKGIPKELWAEEVKKRIEKYTLADLMISLLLSAATDNAKELILSKINGSSKTVNIYLHLIMMGYNIDEIYNFMTSPAIELISELLDTNRFNLYGTTNLTINKALAIIENGVNVWDYDLPVKYDEGNAVYMVDSIVNILKSDPYIKSEIEKILDVDEDFKELKRGEFFKKLFQLSDLDIVSLFNNVTLKLGSSYNNLNGYLAFVDDYTYIYHLKELYLNLYSNENGFYEDILEFKNLQDSVAETRKLGDFIQMCKELPAKYSGIVGKLNLFEKWFEDKFKELKWSDENDNYIGVKLDKSGNISEKFIKALHKLRPYLSIDYIKKTFDELRNHGIINITNENGKFKINYKLDFNKFVQNKQYQQAVIQGYNLVKVLFNVYDVITKLPQYKPALKGYAIVHKLFNSMSIKSKIIESIRTEMKNNDAYLNEDKINAILTYAEELLIRYYLRKNIGKTIKIKFPIMEGLEFYDKNIDRVIADSSKWLELKFGLDFMSFKIFIELYLIPQILSGELKLPDEQIITIEDNYIASFLKTGQEDGKVVRKMRISSKEILKNVQALLEFKRAMNSLESLPVIEIDGEKYSVADWLALYSLIVYRNHPGNDRIASLFSNMIMSEKTNFAQQYVDSIGELDFETSNYSDEEINRFLHEELFFNYEAAKYKTAKTYSYRQAENIKDSEYFINTEDNIPVYYTRKKGETAKEYNLFGFLSGDKKVVNKRRSNIAKDGVLFIPNLDENNELFNLIRDEKYGDVIKELEYLRKLAIQIKC